MSPWLLTNFVFCHLSTFKKICGRAEVQFYCIVFVLGLKQNKIEVEFMCVLDNLVLSTELIMWIGRRKEIWFESRISFQWPIYIVNAVDKTKLSCNTPTDTAPQFLYVCVSRSESHGFANLYRMFLLFKRPTVQVKWQTLWHAGRGMDLKTPVAQKK